MHAVRELLKHTARADRIMVGALRFMDPEDLTRPVGAGWVSILGTMAHVLGAERLWMSRFVGNPLDHLPGIEACPDLEALEAGFAELWPELEVFIASLSEAQLAAQLTWTNLRGTTFTQPLWQPALHMANHSTHHRGQVMLMLRQLGYQPPDVGMF